LQSGSFRLHRHRPAQSAAGRSSDPHRRVRHAYLRTAKGGERAQSSSACGVYESLIYENRSLVPLLSSTGIGVRFRGGARRAQLEELARIGCGKASSWLYRDPLLFIYE